MLEYYETVLKKPRLAPSISMGKGYDSHAELVEVYRAGYQFKHTQGEISEDMLHRCQEVLDDFSKKEKFLSLKNPYNFKVALAEALENLFSVETLRLK